MFKQFGTLGKLTILAIITFVCLLTALVLGSAGAIIYGSVNGMEATVVAKEAGYLRAYQIVSSLIIFVIPAIMCALLFGEGCKNGLYLNQKTNFKSISIALLAMAAAIPLSSILGELNSQLTLPHFMQGVEEWMRQKEESAQGITEQLLTTNSFGIYLYNIVVFAIVPALGEELYFRATLQKIITHNRPILAAGIAAVLFSAFHLQFYGFAPRLLLGFMLGIMLVCTQNIIVPVAAHFFNNFVAVTAYYITGGDIQPGQNQPVALSIVIALASVAAVWWLLDMLWKKNKKSVIQVKKSDIL